MVFIGTSRKQKREHFTAPFLGVLTRENRFSLYVIRVRLELPANGLKDHCRDSLSAYNTYI